MPPAAVTDGSFLDGACRNSPVKKQLRTKTGSLDKRRETAGAKCFLLKPPPLPLRLISLFLPQTDGTGTFKRGLAASGQ